MVKIVEDYIESLMRESTPDVPVWNIEKAKAGKKSDWDYIDGCMILAFLEFYKERHDGKFLSFSENYVGYRVSEDGNIKGYVKDTYNLDNINAGKNLLTLYELTGEDKYRLAADRIYGQILEQPRTKEGNFWHKQIYPDQVWLDGLYMVMPFYVKYANLFLDEKEKAAAYKDIYDQFFNVEKYLKDEKTGLYYHAYDSSRKMFWCDKTTGLSQNFWLRSLGWFSMALLDSILLLDDTDSEEHKHLVKMFTSFVDSVLRFQSPTGMWCQLPAYPEENGNYLETSGSAIFAYCLKKGFKAGLLTEKHYEAGQKAFDDICRRYLTVKDGRMGLGGICLVAGLGGQDRRDGTYAYYMSEPIVSDDAKGTGPFILAYLY